MKTALRIWIAAFGLYCALMTAATALESTIEEAEFSATRLILGEVLQDAPPDENIGMAAKQDTAEAVDDGGPRRIAAGLEITLEEGWKTYWRSPGDAGFPLVITVAEHAENLTDVTFEWPYPHRFVEEWGLEVFGFKNRVVIPVTLSIADAAVDTQAVLDVSYAVCSDICINEEQQLAVTIPAGYTQGEAAHMRAIAAAQAAVPRENGGHGMTIASATIREEQQDKGILAVRVLREEGHFSAPQLFIETDVAGLRFPEAAVERGDSPQEIVLAVPYEIAIPAKTLVGQSLRLTLVDEGKAVETTLAIAKPDKALPSAGAAITDASSSMGVDVPLKGAAATADVAAPYVGGEVSLLAMVVLALLGGVILNIMPCVLPVLSIKLLGAVKHGGGNIAEVRRSFLATVAGILAFFLLLAGLTIAAKHAGQAVGWGFHFQSAEFLTFLTVLVVLFAANLLGLFEIQLPAWLNTHIYDVTGNGALKHRHHALGDFMLGAFAALMATPCTAPFLGTAVGFALARGDSEILIIFLALGWGLSLPYLLAALWPQLVTWMPKPGMWMLRVKQVMGVSMAIAAAWLLWVIAGQTAPLVAVGVLGLSVLLGMVMHGGGRWRFLRRKPVVALICAVLVVVLAWLPGFSLTRYQETPVLAGEDALWQDFDEAHIATAVEAGKVVFVDVTADWCLTCKFNKLRVLSREDIRALLAAEDVLAMQADMTRPMPRIQDYLRANGRYGIPFNIVYGPAAPEGIALSEVLTVEAVTEAIVQARGK